MTFTQEYVFQYARELSQREQDKLKICRSEPWPYFDVKGLPSFSDIRSRMIPSSSPQYQEFRRLVHPFFRVRLITHRRPVSIGSIHKPFHHQRADFQIAGISTKYWSTFPILVSPNQIHSTAVFYYFYSR